MDTSGRKELISNSAQQKENNLIERPKLHALLEEATKNQAVIIVAGPGYGKSTAVSSFLTSEQHTTWVFLSPMDNVHSKIWEHFCSVSSEAWVRKGVSLKNLGFPDTEYIFEKFVKILLENLDEEKRYYLVLDDFHNITNPSILYFVEKLALTRIPNLCIIIISRTRPLINTVLLLSKNVLSTIDESALWLSEEEMNDYFYKQGIVLLESAISEFHEYTKGWIFATYLVCLALEPNKLYKRNPFSAVELDVYRMLESEIYSDLPQKVKKLLLKFSLLENLPFELALRLAEEQELVYKILDIGSFIVFDKFSHSIHIHHIFLDFLHTKTNNISKINKDKVHLFAAKWYEENGYRIDAIIQYEKVGHYDFIIDLLLSFNKDYPVKTMDYLLEVINRIPDQFIKEKPIVRFLYIKFLMNNFRIEEANTKLIELQNELEHLPLTPEIEMTLGEVYAHLAFQSLIKVGIVHTYEFVEYFELAYQYLPKGSSLTDQPCVTCGSYICIISSHKVGEVDNFINALDKMDPFVTKLFRGAYGGYSSIAKAEFAYFQKNIKRAEKYIYQALQEAQDGQSMYIEIYTLFLQLRLSVITEDCDTLIDILKQQKQVVKRLNTPKGYAAHDIAKGWFYAQLGQVDKVPVWIKDEERSKEVLTPVTFAADRLVRAKVLLRDNEIYKLLSLLNSKANEFTIESNLFGCIEMLVLKAIALNCVKEHQEAAEVFMEAYNLSAPNEIIMPFVENGKYTRTLLNHITPYLDVPLEWLKDIQTKANTYAKKISNISVNLSVDKNVNMNMPILSKRETEILTSLCQNLTRREIADSCELSINTIKTLIDSIYSKLGVNSRIEAVRIATRMNLL